MGSTGGSEASDVRVAALSPAIGLTMRALGLEELIVARHGSDAFLDEGLPTGGDQVGIDYETLLRVKPTHVLMEWGSRGPPARLAELAEREGWELENFGLLTLEDVAEATVRVAEVVGDAGARERAGELAAEMRGAWGVADEAARERAGTVLLVYWMEPLDVAGPGSFHQQMIEAMGYEPAIKRGSAYVTLDREELRRIDPGVIVFFAPGDDTARARGAVGKLEGLGLAAVEGGRVVVVTHPASLIPSPELGEVAAEIQKGIDEVTG